MCRRCRTRCSNGIVTLEPQNLQAVAVSDDGRTVAVGDDRRTVAVGDGGDRPPEWEPGMNAVGSVSVFHRDDTGRWQREAYFIRPHVRLVGDRTNEVGEVLALSGDGHTLAAKVREGSGTGGIYVFARNAQHPWSEQALLGVGSGELASRLALSADGNWMAASESNGFMVYARTEGQWRTDSRVTPPDIDSPAPDRLHIVLEATTGLAISGNGKVVATRGTGRMSLPGSFSTRAATATAGPARPRSGRPGPRATSTGTHSDRAWRWTTKAPCWWSATPVTTVPPGPRPPTPATAARPDPAPCTSTRRRTAA